MNVQTLLPQHDSELPRFGIGFSDVVKRPTANAAGLTARDFEEHAPRLIRKLRRYRPLVACFHGLMAYRPFLKFALGSDSRPVLGPQPISIGDTRIFVVPNPSPANAHFTVIDQAAWYDRLAEYLHFAKTPLETET